MANKMKSKKCVRISRRKKRFPQEKKQWSQPMSFNPEMSGKAMAKVVNRAVDPLKAKIADLRRQLAELPAPVTGKDGVDGRDGKSFTLDDAQPIIEKAIGLIRDEAEAAYQKALDRKSVV